MIKSYSLIAALVFSPMLIAAPQAHHNHSDKYPQPAQQAHLHGTAELTLALEGNALEISFQSPAANIVGFEHKATSKKHLKAVEQARVKMESSDLFLFFGSDCRLKQAKVDMSSVIEQGSQYHHDHGDKDRDSHSEINANYSYECSKGEKLEALSVDLIPLFPAIGTLEVMWLTDSQQGAVELTAKSNIIRIR
jgi:hypothetical protein